MALGRNHKIFNIGNASGTIQGLTRVYHDLTLSGDGTLSSLLGVVGSQDDEEVNQYVYDNSATIDEVNTSYKNASGTFLTAIPDYYATTGDINDLAQSISETYQVKGDYVERNSMDSAIESATSGKLDASSFASVSSDFLVASSLNGYATESFVEETSGAITSLIPTDYYPDTNPSAFVNEDWVTAQGYITGVDLTPYQPKSGMIDYQTTAGMTAYATTGDVANKLDTTSFSNVSSTFLTAHQIIPSAKWENASDVVESNSAQWGENTGDEEVNNAVYNNSAKWNDISVYQSNSSTYLTAHQDISNKLDTTAFSEVSGDFLTTAFEISQSAKWEEATNAYEQNSGTYLTAHQDLTYISGQIDNKLNKSDFNIPESATWNDVSTTVQSNSADWASHQDLSYISAQVDNKLDSSSFVPNDFYPMTGNPSGFLTAHQDWTDTITAASANAYNEAIAQIPPQFDPTYISGVIDNKLNTTAFSDVSGTFLTAVSIPESADWSETTDVVQTNSGKWNDISAYQNASAGYLTAHQSLADYYTTADANALSSMLSGAIDYVSANAGDDTELSAYVPYSALEVSIGSDNVTTYTAFAQGSNNTAKYRSFSQGTNNYSIDWSLAQGFNCSARNNSIAQGASNTAYGYSQAFGSNNIITNTGMAIGTCNKTSANVAFVIGNGTSKTNRSDAFVIGMDGSVSAAGKISANGVELGAGGNPEVENYVFSNSALIDETISTYQTNSSTYLTAVDLTPYYTTADANILSSMLSGAIDYVSANVGDEFPVSADEACQYVQNTSATIDVVNTTYQNASGTYLTAVDLSNYVQVSAYNELKTSYDVLSASYATLSSLFATYSGQWLLPNEGV